MKESTMARSAMTADENEVWVERYLTLLGVERAAPSFAALSELTRAHCGRIGYENVTSLLRRAAHPTGPVPALDYEELLSNWETRRGGAVCYEMAGMVARLLERLGYDVSLALGQIGFPDGHYAAVVSFASGRFMVDVGGSPFFEPIALDRSTVVRRAGLVYRFLPDETGAFVDQDRLINEVWTPFCRYKLRPSTEEERDASYQRHHEMGVSWVTGDLRLVRCEEQAVFAYGNGELTHYSETGKRTTPVSGQAEIARMVAETFHLPALPLAAADAARAG